MYAPTDASTHHNVDLHHAASLEAQYPSSEFITTALRSWSFVPGSTSFRAHYKLECACSQRGNWVAWKTYTDFKTLCATEGLAGMPPKHYFAGSSDSHVVEERMAAFSEVLAEVCSRLHEGHHGSPALLRSYMIVTNPYILAQSLTEAACSFLEANDESGLPRAHKLSFVACTENGEIEEEAFSYQNVHITASHLAGLHPRVTKVIFGGVPLKDLEGHSGSFEALTLTHTLTLFDPIPVLNPRRP